MIWINVILLFLLTAGHAQVLATIVNRTHALALPPRPLKHLRHLQDVMIFLFPVVAVIAIGINGPGLFVGGHWSDLSLGWAIYLTMCVLGTIALIVTSLAYHMRRNPASLLHNHSTIVDIEERLGYRPIGEGPFRFLTRVPMNELFQLEVAEKALHLPHLPDEWDGLSIVQLSDLHFIGTLDRPFFDQVIELTQELEPDLVVLTGDLIDNPDLVDWFPDTFGRLSAPLGCYFVLGNHEWNHDPQRVRDALTALGWRDMAGTVEMIEHENHSLAIAGNERPWMGIHPDLSQTPEDAFRLVLSHTPDNINWARRNRVDLMLCGHNHGGQVILPMIGPVYSPSIYGCRYSGGLFHESPTLLHVSRGISGRHPLRLNCRPELTKFVFHTKS
jgi:uncharacterized protein